MRTHQCSRPGDSHPSNLNNMKGVPANQKKDIFSPFLKTVFPPLPNKFAPELYHGQAREYTQEHVTVKVPTNSDRTHFKWTR